MSVIHKFVGQWGEVFKWEGARFRRYGNGASEGASETWLIGKAEQAQNFALRYYELEGGGHSRKETHAHDHGILFLRGAGHVLIENDVHGVAEGDVVYIAPNEPHQIINTSDEVLGWLCIIPARRVKNDKTVWAEEGLDDLVVVSD
jgi:quercetin dioxygenase-like cupin family protein